MRKGGLNNRHLVIACIFLGSLIRVVYIPIVDNVIGTPDAVKYTAGASSSASALSA